jgi:hypothetical protein
MEDSSIVKGRKKSMKILSEPHSCHLSIPDSRAVENETEIVYGRMAAILIFIAR